MAYQRFRRPAQAPKDPSGPVVPGDEAVVSEVSSTGDNHANPILHSPLAEKVQSSAHSGPAEVVPKAMVAEKCPSGFPGGDPVRDAGSPPTNQNEAMGATDYSLEGNKCDAVVGDVAKIEVLTNDVSSRENDEPDGYPLHRAKEPTSLASKTDSPPKQVRSMTCGRPHRPSQSPKNPSRETGRSSLREPDELARSEADQSRQTAAGEEWPFLGFVHKTLGPASMAVIVGITGLLALYIYCQLLAVVASLAVLPLWMSIPAILFFGLLLAMVVLAFGRLVAVYLRLRRNRQVRMKDLESLMQRVEMRKSVDQRHEEARQILWNYVKDYPIPQKAAASEPDDTGQMPALPAQTGTLAGLLDKTQLEDLRRSHSTLREHDEGEDSEVWFGKYAGFQKVLDKAAEARVGQCAKWVAWKTVVSPSPIVDVLVVSYWAFVLLRDLCLIYNVRVGPLGTTALLGRVFFNAYIAGRLEGLEDHAEDAFHATIGEMLPSFWEKIISKVAVKSSIGLANYYLITRLGKHAIRLLQPLA